MPKNRVVKITKRSVDAAAPNPEGRYCLLDTELRGFALRILETGVKSYVFRYRTLEGRDRRATIGQHGPWTPHQARQKAEEWRQVVKAGGDPLAEREAKRVAPTVGEMLEAYLGSERFKEKAPSTQAVDRGRIARHLMPLLGKRHVHLLTPEDITRAFNAIRAGKTAAKVKTKKRGLARVTGGPGTGREAMVLLRAIFAWAVREGLAKSNPAEKIQVGQSGTRETILEQAEEYARLFATLDRMEAECRINRPVADAIRLIALTGCRRGEAAGLQWQHVDLKKGRVVLPPQSHKTGRRTGKPREITLPAAAQAIIARQPEGKPSDFVFQPSRGSGPVSLSPSWRKVRVEAKLPEGVGLHGLRHSLASHLAMGGAEAAQIMTVMGHRQLSTVQRYIHFASTAKQALAERVATVAIAGMAASSGKTAKVVKMTKRPRR
jgi:integrase